MTDLFRQEVEESIHPTHVGLECNTLTHTHAHKESWLQTCWKNMKCILKYRVAIIIVKQNMCKESQG